MIAKAAENDTLTVSNIVQDTIDSIYPRYYPSGAVDFFKKHHDPEKILDDVLTGKVYVLWEDEHIVGTVTINENEVCRLFVLPEYQHKGYGRKLMDHAESEIGKRYKKAILDSSLPAMSIYQRRGYTETAYRQVMTDNGDYLCYDVMEKIL